MSGKLDRRTCGAYAIRPYSLTAGGVVPNDPQSVVVRVGAYGIRPLGRPLRGRMIKQWGTSTIIRKLGRHTCGTYPIPPPCHTPKQAPPLPFPHPAPPPNGPRFPFPHPVSPSNRPRISFPQSVGLPNRPPLPFPQPVRLPNSPPLPFLRPVRLPNGARLPFPRAVGQLFRVQIGFSHTESL